MIKRQGKRLGAMLLGVMILVGCLPSSVHAEDAVTEIEIPSYHYTADTDDEVLAVSQALMRGAYLASGTTKLTNKGGGVVSIYGTTTCSQICDMVYLNIYLERSTDGVGWVSYDSWPFTKSSAFSLSQSFTKSVAKGYYYRLRGYHAAKVGSILESTSTSTSAIYIS